MNDDPYDILGVSKDSSREEINAAYRAKARDAHPDKGGSTEEFTRIKQASMVLLDPKMRERFDRTGKVEETAADNRRAKVMEMVANFFISSLDALDDPRAPSIEHVNLVTAGRAHFENQIRGANEHIGKLEKKVKKYTRALKRLKCKKNDDVVMKMLTHHVNNVEGLIKGTHLELELLEEALRVLDDYDFEPEQGTLTTRPHEHPYRSPFFR